MNVKEYRKLRASGLRPVDIARHTPVEPIDWEGSYGRFASVTINGAKINLALIPDEMPPDFSYLGEVSFPSGYYTNDSACLDYGDTPGNTRRETGEYCLGRPERDHCHVTLITTEDEHYRSLRATGSYPGPHVTGRAPAYGKTDARETAREYAQRDLKTLKSILSGDTQFYGIEASYGDAEDAVWGFEHDGSRSSQEYIDACAWEIAREVAPVHSPAWVGEAIAV